MENLPFLTFINFKLTQKLLPFTEKKTHFVQKSLYDMV